jgi:PAS domain S-box-containing protein
MYCVARDCKETIEKATIEKQEIIQQSELRFKTLVQEGSDLIRILDQKGNFLYVSPASKSILGFEPEYFIGKHTLDFIHPDDRGKKAECLKKINTEKKVTVDAIRYINGKGEWQWMESVLTNMLDNPAIKGIVANSRDVTEEKRLKELNRKTNKLAKIGSWEVDLVNNSIFWSDEVHQLHETNPSSFVPNLISGINFYRKDFQKIVQKRIENCINKGDPFDFEAVLVTLNKKEKWVRAIGNGEFIDGVCKRIYGSFQDINDIKEIQNRLQSFAENLPGVIYQYTIYPDGTDAIDHISGAVEQLWGYTVDQINGNTNLLWQQIIKGGDIEQVKSSIQKAIQTKSRWTCRFRIIKPDGTQHTHLGNGTPIFLSNGSIVFNTMVLDVTKETKNELMLSQASKLAKIGSWEVDLVNNSILWTDEVHELHQTDPNTFVPNLDSAINFYREDFKDIIQKKVENCIVKGESFDFEAVLVTAKKRELWVRSIGNAEFVDGVCKRIYGSFQDIDDLKEAELKLLSLSENLPGVIYQYKINPDGTDALTYVAGAAEKIWGFSAEEVMEDLNLVWNQIRAGGDFEEAQASILNSIQTKSRWSFRFRYVMPNGELKVKLGNGTPLFLADGTILFNSIVLDITEEAKNEELLNQASEMASIGSWEMNLINPDSDSMYWSPMAKEIIGVSPDYLPTLKSGLEFCHGESKGVLSYAVKSLIKDGLKFDIELQFITAFGENRWARVIGKSERIKNRCAKIYGSFQDITISKKIEIELIKAKERAEESEVKFKAYTEQSPVAIYTTDVHGDCVYANQTYLDMLGLSLNDVLGKGWLNALHPDDVKWTSDSWYKSSNLKGKWHYEYRFINKKGKTIWVDGTAKELFNEKNEFIGYLGTNVDITERKKVKESLIKANERFEKATEATNDAIWDWDIEKKTLYRSKAIEYFFGDKTSKLISEHDFWKDCFHPEDLPKLRDSIEKSIADPNISRWEFEYRILKNDKIVYVIDKGMIIRNGQGKAVRMVGAMTNLTNQKEAQLQEERLVRDILQRNKNLEQFSYIISHNLRAPVANILGLISLLNEEDNPKETIDFINKSLYASANKLDEVIKDLNEILQVKNNVTESKELINFSKLAADINFSIDTQIKSDNTVINWDFTQAPEIKTIKSYMHSIFYNLISNSLKYRQKDIPLLIEIKSELIDNKIILYFKDNGMGIDLTKQNNMVFGLYKRFHTDYAEGKGVGLFMVKTQVEAIGGAISVTSKVNEGTQFMITLPLT